MTNQAYAIDVDTMDKQAYILDVETTGVTPHPVHGHPQVIELAYLGIDTEIDEIKRTIAPFIEKSLYRSAINIGEALGKTYRYMPSMPIHKRAREVHGIWAKDLIGKPKSETLKLPDMKYMIGHNISYDHRCLGKPDIPLVCTLALSRRLDKFFGIGFKSHKQDRLIDYYYGDRVDGLTEGTHAAITDCCKTLFLLLKLCEETRTLDTIQDVQRLLSMKAK